MLALTIVQSFLPLAVEEPHWLIAQANWLQFEQDRFGQGLWILLESSR